MLNYSFPYSPICFECHSNFSFLHIWCTPSAPHISTVIDLMQIVSFLLFNTGYRREYDGDTLDCCLMSVHRNPEGKVSLWFCEGEGECNMIERIYILCLIIIIKSEVWTIAHCLTLKHRETHGCVVSTVATDALVLKHQAISIHNAD